VWILPVTSGWLILLEESRVKVGLHALESTSICLSSATALMSLLESVPGYSPAEVVYKCSHIPRVAHKGVKLTWHHLAHIHWHTAHASSHSAHRHTSHGHSAHHIIHAPSASHARTASHATHHATTIIESSEVSAHRVSREASHGRIETTAHVAHTRIEGIISVEVVHVVVHIAAIVVTSASSTEISPEVPS
jgi:hypothetical protein